MNSRNNKNYQRYTISPTKNGVIVTPQNCQNTATMDEESLAFTDQDELNKFFNSEYKVQFEYEG